MFKKFCFILYVNVPNYWSRFTHFHSIRSPAPPTAPPLRALRLVGLTGLTETCISIFCHVLCLPTLPLPLRPRRPLACRSLTDLAAAPRSPSRRTRRLTETCISIFCHMTPRRAARFCRRLDRADLAADLSPTSPPLRALRLAGLAGLTETCISIFYHALCLPTLPPPLLPRRPRCRSLADRAAAPRSPSRRTRRLTETCISIFYHALCLPTFPPPLRPRRPRRRSLADRAAAPRSPSHRTRRLTETCISIFYHRPRCSFHRHPEGFFSPPLQLKNNEFAKSNRIRLCFIISHLCSFVNYC